MSIARTKYKVTKSLLLLGILCTGLLSAFIGLVAFFGQYMGTFVISLDDDTTKIGITLSDNIGFTNPGSRLLVNPVNSADPTTFNDIDFARAIQTDGDFDSSSTNNYIAYTFYIKNEGNAAVDVSFNVDIITATNNVDAAMRMALIEDGAVDKDGNVTMRDGKLYYKDEDNKDPRAYSLLDEAKLKIYEQFDNTRFTGNKILDNYMIENFRPSDVRKYTLIIWLEGWDDDCTDSIIRGQLKMKLTFSIFKIIEDDVK